MTAPGKKRTASEIAHARALAMLARVKPYDEWIATAGQNQLAAAEKLAGSPRKAYDEMVRALLRMAEVSLPANLQ